MEAVGDVLGQVDHGDGVEGAFVGAVTLRVEYLRVPYDVEHDRVVSVVGVERVEDVAGFEVEPPDIVGSTLAGQNSDACGVGGIPGIGHVRVPADPLSDHGGDRIGYSNAADERREHQPCRCSQYARHDNLGALTRIEGDWQIVEHHMVLGEREVVHHRATRDGDIDGMPSAPVGHALLISKIAA